MMSHPPTKTQHPRTASLLLADENRVFRPDPELSANFTFADDPPGVDMIFGARDSGLISCRSTTAAAGLS
jgi:hypothetical protein